MHREKKRNKLRIEMIWLNIFSMRKRWFWLWRIWMNGKIKTNRKINFLCCDDICAYVHRNNSEMIIIIKKILEEEKNKNNTQHTIWKKIYVLLCILCLAYAFAYIYLDSYFILSFCIFIFFSFLVTITLNVSFDYVVCYMLCVGKDEIIWKNRMFSFHIRT